jgi:hypothetical protein
MNGVLLCVVSDCTRRGEERRAQEWSGVERERKAQEREESGGRRVQMEKESSRQKGEPSKEERRRGGEAKVRDESGMFTLTWDAE